MNTVQQNYRSSDSLLVGIDFTNGKDVGVLIVGRRNGEKIDIVNTFQGDEAMKVYKQLIEDNNNGNITFI